jgi:hypothetical protein
MSTMSDETAWSTRSVIGLVLLPPSISNVVVVTYLLS